MFRVWVSGRRASSGFRAIGCRGLELEKAGLRRTEVSTIWSLGAKAEDFLNFGFRVYSPR